MRILYSVVIYFLLSSGLVFKSEKSEMTNSVSSENAVNMDNLRDVHGWVLDKVTSDKPCDTNNDGVYTIDVLSEMPQCMRDDRLFIQKNNIAYYERGVSCCDDPVENMYTWSLKGKKFTMAQKGIEDSMDIISLDDKKFVVSTRMEAQGEMFTFRITFVH
jgi:hypothetical protein